MIPFLGTRLAVAVSFVVAIASVLVVSRRRAVFLLGRRTAMLAPSVLFTLWLAALAIGERTGSLVGMAYVGVVPLVAAAVAARRWTAKRRGALFPSWSWVDRAVVVTVAGILLVVDLFDVHCHRAVAGAFLRGNVPPTALNDPAFPLPYHALFDAVVALVMRAVPVDTELGLDLIGIGCVALTMNHVIALSRRLFRSAAAAQVSRVLFFFGFGPTVLRYLWSGPSMRLLHGESTQAYVDIILRRPTVLGLTIFTLILAMLAPLFEDGAGRRASAPAAAGKIGRGPHPLWLAPALFVVPLLAEEMILHVSAFVAVLVVRRRIAPRWVLAGAVVFALGALSSGAFVAVLGGRTSMATPRLVLSWPPTLPSWTDSDHGVPLWSRDGALALLAELGPLLAATYVLVGVRGPRLARAMLAPLVAGLAASLVFRLDGWNKADMDRFLFTGTPVAMMLVARWIDLAATPSAASAPSRLGRRRGPRLGAALGVALALVMAGPPAVYAVYTAATNARSWRAFWRDQPGESLRETLVAVGAREPILTDRDQADSLVQAGFIVLGPMLSTSVGNVDEDHFDEYLKTNASRAAWLYLPRDDARVAGRPIVAERERYCLVRAGDVGAAPVTRPR